MAHRYYGQIALAVAAALFCVPLAYGDARTSALAPRQKQLVSRPGVLSKVLPTARFRLSVPRVRPPTPAQVGALPWKAGERTNPNAMRKVRALLPPAMRNAVDRPVADLRYRKLIADKAAAFRVGGRAVPLKLKPGSFVDLGASNPLESRSAAVVELSQSPAFTQEIQQRLKVDPAKSHVTALVADELVVDVTASGAAKSTQYRQAQTTYVSVVAKDTGKTSLWRVEDGEWKNLYNQVAPPATTRARRANLMALGRLSSAKTKKYFGGSTLVDLSKPQAGLRATSSRLVPATVWSKASDRVAFLDVNRTTASPRSCSVLGASSLSSTYRASSSNNLVLTNCPSSIGLQTPPPAQEGTGGASGTGGSSATGGNSEPPGYTAYGNPAVELLTRCGHQCSQSTCMYQCCLPVYLGEMAVAANFSAICHGAAFFMWWVHVFCAIQETSLIGAATAMYGNCLASCSYSYWNTANDNPRRCSVHQR